MENVETRRGRKTLEVQFPKGEFSVKQIAVASNVSMVTAQNRVNAALINKSVGFVRKDKQPGKGRKYSLYSLI